MCVYIYNYITYTFMLIHLLFVCGRGRLAVHQVIHIAVKHVIHIAANQLIIVRSLAINIIAINMIAIDINSY